MLDEKVLVVGIYVHIGRSRVARSIWEHYPKWDKGLHAAATSGKFKGRKKDSIDWEQLANTANDSDGNWPG